MKIPIYLHYNEDVSAVEERWRKSIRKDRTITKGATSLAVILYEHPSGAVGVMYEAQYRRHDTEYSAALAALGFKLVRTVQMLTCHATILRRVV